MNPDTFDSTLRSFVNKDPFEPFVVELIDGRQIEILRPELSFGGGAAGFLSDRDELVGFLAKDVRVIRPLRHEMAQ